MPALDADAVLQESLERARKLLLDAPGTEVLHLLQTADTRLKRGLVGVVAGQPGVRFSEAQSLAYAKQIDVAVRYVKKRLLGITHAKAKDSIKQAVFSTVRDLERLDKAFTGIATPLRLREAASMAGIRKGTYDSLLGQHATSVDRYGNGMIRQFRTIMRDGLIQGVTQGQMVDALVGHGGPRGPKVSTRATVGPSGKVVRLKEEKIPEGLFVRKKYWAERVVRTEVAHGQNEARLRSIEEARQDFPDMGKKILAMMDIRTAYDSAVVHGQVRPTDGLFQDGAGRQYQRPPARPNDRETIVPWRLSWDETPYSAPMPPKQLAELQQAKEAPGPAKQVAIRQAAKSFEARLDTRARRAMRNVQSMIGKHLGGRAAAAIAARNVVGYKAEEATAKAQQRAAQQRAVAVQQAANVRARARAQLAVTAAAKAKAKIVATAKEARARASRYRKELAAKQRGKLTVEANRNITSTRKLLRKPSSVAAATQRLEKLAVKSPEVFGETYRLVVKDDGELSPRFFQSLAKDYKAHSRKIVDLLRV